MEEPDIYYDAPSGTLSIRVSDTPSVESYEPVPGVMVAVNAEGDMTSMEFMGKVRERFAPVIDAFLAEARAQHARRAS